jgi:hypothetical protein
MLILILFFLLFIFILLKSIQNKKELYSYISNTSDEDVYVKKWNNLLFVPNQEKINYIVTYHYTDNLDNKKDYFNIMIDGEPKDLQKYNPDILLTTKKERINPITKNIYIPYFVWSFVQKGINPEILIKKNDEKITKNKFCAFMYSNCDEKFSGVVKRKNFLKLFQKMSGNRVDNLGKCYNDNYKKNGNWVNSSDIYKDYKFVVAFENEMIDGYITEKLVMPMVSRSIPIYLGDRNVGNYFNKKSFICVNDFNSFEDCIKYVLEVDKNKELYESILREPYLHGNSLNYDLFSLYFGGEFFRNLYDLLPDNLSGFIRPCNFYNHDVRFITFADGNVYNYERILEEARVSKFFKKCKAYDYKSLKDTDYFKKHSKFIKENKRGFGYWIWKPYIIWLNLLKMKEGDYLVYADSGCTINSEGVERVKYYYSLLERKDLICFEIKYDEKTWNKMDCVLNVLKYKNSQFNLENIMESKQRTTSLFLLKKNNNTIKFINDWLNLSQNYQNLNDSKSENKNNISFKEHRHDQSIFSLLTKIFPDFECLQDNYSDEKNEFLLENGKQRPFIPSRKKN